MWSAVLRPGLGLLDGRVREVRVLGQELAHHVVHSGPGVVLWCDGDHGFNPYDFAELNIVRGFAADDGAQRVLIKRCMTPFQWDTVLTRQLGAKLGETDTALVLALPYDRLFSTDELQPWEQVDYVRYSLEHLRTLAARHRVPILLGVDVQRWRMTHPPLDRLLVRAFDHRFSLRRPRDGARVIPGALQGADPQDGRQATLAVFLDPAAPGEKSPDPGAA